MYLDRNGREAVVVRSAVVVVVVVVEGLAVAEGRFQDGKLDP